MTKDDPTPTSPTEKTIRRRRYGIRRQDLKSCGVVALLFLFIGLPILALVLNGPVFRNVARIGIAQGLRTQGLSGNASVTGTLWSGFSIKDAHFSGGTKGIRSLIASEIEVRYEAWRCITAATDFAWLQSLRAHQVTIELNAIPRTEEEQALAQEKRRLKKEQLARENRPPAYSPFWNLLSSSIRLENIHVLIHDQDQSTRYEGIHLTVPTPSTPGELSIASISLPNQEPVHGIRASITSHDRSLQLTDIKVGTLLSLDHLELAEPSPEQFTAAARWHMAGSDLSLEIDSHGQLNLQMAPDTSLDLANLGLPTQPEGLGGRVSQLSLNWNGDFARPATWNLAGELRAEAITWAGQALDSLQIQFENEEWQLLVTKGEARLTTTAKVPFRQAPTTDALQNLAITLDGGVEVPSLANLLTDLGQELPLDGGISAKWEALTLSKDKLIESGTLAAATRDVTWTETPVGNFHLLADATTSEGIALSASLIQDPHNQLEIEARCDLNTLTYEATAEGSWRTHLAAKDDGPPTPTKLQALLIALGVPPLESALALTWNGSGTLSPAQHQGTADLVGNNIRWQQGLPFDLTVQADYEGSRFSLPRLQLKSASTQLEASALLEHEVFHLNDLTLTQANQPVLKGSMTLPVKGGDEATHGFFDQTDALALDLAVTGLAIEPLARLFLPVSPVAGTLDATVTGTGTPAALNLEGKLNFSPELVPGIAQPGKIQTNFRFQGPVPTPQHWDLELDAIVGGFVYEETELEDLHLQLATSEGSDGKRLSLDLDGTQHETSLKVGASLLLAGVSTVAELGTQEVSANVLLNSPDISPLIQHFAPPHLRELPLHGDLRLSLQDLLLVEGDLTRGKIALESERLTFENAPWERFQHTIEVTAPNQLRLNLALALDKDATVTGQGTYHLKEQRYDGSLDLQARRRQGSQLAKLLAKLPNGERLPHSTALSWAGRGTLPAGEHQGELSLNADSVKINASAEPLAISLSGSYSENDAHFPSFSLSNKTLQLSGSLNWKEQMLSLENWQGMMGKRQVFQAEGSLPLDKNRLSATDWLGQEPPLSLQLSLRQLPLQPLLKSFGQEPPLRGHLNGDLTLQGSPRHPTLLSQLAFDDIAVMQQGADIKAGKLELGLRTAKEQIVLTGSYRHPDVQPCAIEATLPFHPYQWASGERDLMEESLKATAKMARSQLAFLSQQVPGIESIDGTVALDVDVSGSLKKPQLKGNGLFDVRRLRFQNRDAPSLYDIQVDTQFSDNRVDLRRLHAIVAGGVVEGRGSAVFRPDNEPHLDFSISGRKVLVLRRPEVNVRTDADLTISGPFSTAAVSGSIGITNSRFFKNFDLVPAGIPMRRRSALPSLQSAPKGPGVDPADLDLGLKLPPFQNWPIQVRLHTKDPFLVRGNLATSDIKADIAVTGTLGRPMPLGWVSTEQTSLTLPFSQVDVEVGRIEFDHPTRFNGAVELKARARADQYRVNVYLHNRILTPQYVLTSTPPLESEDIVTLLVTGSTRNEMVGEDAGSVAASKAASLLFKNMQRASAATDKGPTLLDKLEDRTELRVGGVNPRTGEHSVGGNIRLWKQLFFVGDMDSDSDYRALLKYVFRFD